MKANLTPAAQYVRMSTDDQQYSIANQAAAIQKYANSHGYIVIATYSDPGRSGVTIQGRPGLNSLLQDVVSAQAPFRAILVYDVSRWGRFQDEDEAGHYEFLCRRAGIPVHYCGEAFDSNGLASNSIMKALKRSMAAEFSRELGTKVHTGQKRLAGLGFRVCGLPGYGMQRCLLSADGKFKRFLKPNQRKAIKSERVVLTPGKKTEADIVRVIFKLAASEKKNASEIADELNRRHTKYVNGRLWRKETIHRILRSEKYIGTNVWGQTCTRLGRPVTRVPRDLWTRAMGAFTPVIDAVVFNRVQRLIDSRCTHPGKPDEYLLRGMRRVLAREGKLTERLLKGRGIFDQRTFLKRFGSVMRAYELVGYKPSEHAFKSVNNAKRLWSLRLQVVKRLSELFPKHVRIVRQPSQKMRQVIELNNGSRIAISLCVPKPSVYGKQRWLLKIQPKEHGLPALLCTVNMNLDRITNFYVVPEVYQDRKFVMLSEHHPLLTSGEKIDSLALFYDTALRSVRPIPCRKMVKGDVVLPPRAVTISIGSKEIDLDPTAYKLFTILLSATDQVVSREQLSEALPGGTKCGILTPHIHCLRKQLGSFRRRICTVVGQGYMYTRKSMPAERLTPATSTLVTGKESRQAS